MIEIEHFQLWYNMQFIRFAMQHNDPFWYLILLYSTPERFHPSTDGKNERKSNQTGEV